MIRQYHIWDSIYPKGKEILTQPIYLYPHVHCSIVYNTSTWKWPTYQTMDEWIKKCSVCIQWKIIWPWTMRKWCQLEQCGWILRALCSVKSARQRQTLYDLNSMWTLNTHTPTHTKPGLTNTENSLVFAGSGGVVGRKWAKVRTSSYEINKF